MLDRGRDTVPEEGGSGERFTVPEVETQKEGSKTVIRNFASIADRFGREEKHLSTFLMNELGTAGHVDGTHLVLQGTFRRGVLNKKVEAYADRFVRCPECGRPDTTMEKEKGVEILKCEACGARKSIES